MEHQFSRADIEDYDPKRCWVDNKKNISDQHHIVPIEYGGPEDGLTVPLCPTCHRNVHREAAAQLKGKPPNQFVNDENYHKEEQHNRAMFLVKYIVQAKQRFDNTGEKKAKGARNMIQISCTREELAIAHDLKKQLGFRSLERTLKYLILDRWKQLKQGK